MSQPQDADFTMSDPEIPNFTVPDEGFSFPAGGYLLCFGKIKAVFVDDTASGLPEAVLHDIWVLKYLGTESKPDSLVRITVQDNQVKMGTKGVKLVERYPNPISKPNMAWRAKAFFGAFECITEIPTGANDANGKPEFTRVVDWKKVAAKRGVVFSAQIIYQENPKSPNKRYRNINYQSIAITPQTISLDHLKMIEQKYEQLKMAEEQTGSTEAPPTVDDLPF